jgi:hypothetical protein
MTKKTKKTVVMPTEVVVNADGTTETLSMKPSADILDMKLTRTELIELIVSEIETDLNSQFDVLGKELETVNKEIKGFIKNMTDDVFFDAVLANIRETNKNWRRDTWLDCTGEITGNVRISLPGPKDLLAKRDELNRQCAALNDKIRKLHSKEGKNTIMKQMLSGSDAGQNLLEQIKGFNKGVTAKLMK